MEERYNKLLSKIRERKPQIDRFIEVLHGKKNRLTSPSSTKYHLNKEGSLLEHSVNVAETLLRIRYALAPGISDESCVVAGLFHEVGKVGMPDKPYYLPEMKNGKHTSTYIINPEVVAMGLSLRSLYLISQYIPLAVDEAKAFAYHDGMYVPEGHSVAHWEAQLLLMLYWADMWIASIMEKSFNGIVHDDFS